MNSVLTYIRDMSIIRKLYLSYFLVLILPISIISIILAINISDKTEKAIMEGANHAAEQMSQELSDIIQVGTYAISSQLMDENLRQIANADSKGDSYELIKKYGTYNRISMLKDISPEIEDIQVYISNEAIMETGEIKKLSAKMRETDYFKRAMEHPGKVHFEYMKGLQLFNTNAEQLHLITYLNDYYNHIEFFIVVRIDSDSIQHLFRNTEYPISIITPDHRIEIKDPNNLPNSQSIPLEISIKPKDTADTLSLILSVPLQKRTKAVNTALFNSFLAIMTCFIAAILLIIIFARSITGRLWRIRNYTHEITLGNFDTGTNLIGNDEIGQLATDVTTMIAYIKDLMQKNQEYILRQSALELKHKEAALSLLTNQINPHFLFNTLDTIRMELLMDKDSKASHAILMLSELLRSSIETGSHPIALNKELKMAENYLNLTKIRFGDQFSFHIDCQIEENLLILPFILQPIVENAVIHGLRNCAYAGQITITVKQVGDDIIMEIVDNGTGMDQTRLELLRQSLQASPYEEETQHIGISNVHKRLRLYYGDSYGLSIESIPGSGTSVTAKLRRL